MNGQVCSYLLFKYEHFLDLLLKGASGKAGIRNPESGIGTGTGTGTGIGTGMGRETYIKAGTTFTLI